MSLFLIVVLLLLGLWLVSEPVMTAALFVPSRSRFADARMVLGVALLVIAIGMIAGTASAAATPTRLPTTVVTAPRPDVPSASARYRLQIDHVVADIFGAEGSPARLAAQIHQESLWRENAQSHVGAQGMAQFMPATGRWLAEQFPDAGPYDPWDPEWSLRAAALYDRYLLARNTGDTPCANWAFALSAYNGGERALRREQQSARTAQRNDGLWFDHVAEQRSRSLNAWRENRAYVTRILHVLEPTYIAAGWDGQAVCT